MNTLKLSKHSWLYKFATAQFTLYKVRSQVDDTCSLFNACVNTLYKMFITFLVGLNLMLFVYVTIGSTVLFLTHLSLLVPEQSSVLTYVGTYLESSMVFAGCVLDNIGPAIGLHELFGMFAYVGIVMGGVLGVGSLLASPLFIIGGIIFIVHEQFKESREKQYEQHILALFEQYKDGVGEKKSFKQFLRLTYSAEITDSWMDVLFNDLYYKTRFLKYIGVLGEKSPSTWSVALTTVKSKAQKLCVPIKIVD